MIEVLRHRVLVLERVFTEIAHTRMQGVPMLNPAVHIQALGFVHDPEDTHLLTGILVTPWFMNLLRLPRSASEPATGLLEVGQKTRRTFGNESFDFTGACEKDLGAFEACSLFSPMFEFANHAAAVDTANEILRLLRSSPQPAAMAADPLPSRRGFLFGRGAPTASRTLA
jgi:[NiFe] hydrogenase assembly HybE family chaperone